MPQQRPNFPALFSRRNDTEKDLDFLTPGMALKLYCTSKEMKSVISNNVELYLLYLPSLARKYAQNYYWRLAFLKSFDLICSLLENGKKPIPRCPADDLAMLITLDIANDLDEEGAFDDLSKDFPSDPNDSNFDLARLRLLERELPKDWAFERNLNGVLDELDSINPNDWFEPFTFDDAPDCKGLYG